MALPKLLDMDQLNTNPVIIMPDDPNLYLFNKFGHISSDSSSSRTITYSDRAFNIQYNAMILRYSRFIAIDTFTPIMSVRHAGRVFPEYTELLYFDKLLHTLFVGFEVDSVDGVALLECILSDIDLTFGVETNMLDQIRSDTDCMKNGLFSEDSVREIIQLEKDLDMEIKLVSPYRTIIVFKSIFLGGNRRKKVNCAVCISKPSYYSDAPMRVFKLTDYPNSMDILRTHCDNSAWHPHVNLDGRPCWGEASSIIFRTIRNRNLLAVALYLKSFLETYNENDAMYRNF